jgi:hypothetical protein
MRDSGILWFHSISLPPPLAFSPLSPCSDNEWGIEVCESTAVAAKEAESASAFVESVENLTLEELQEQLASLHAEQEWKMLHK